MGFEIYTRNLTRDIGWRFRDEDGAVAATGADGFAEKGEAKQAIAKMVLAVRGATYGQRDAAAIEAAVTDADE